MKFKNSPFTNPYNIQLIEPGHQYVDASSRIWTSQSAFMKHFIKQFDTEGMSRSSAKKEVKELGLALTEDNILLYKNQLKDKWASKGKRATDHGSFVDNSLEMFISQGVREYPEMNKLYDVVYAKYMKPYHRCFTQEIVYLEKIFTCGTLDLSCVRSSSNKGTFDFFDFKTSLDKVIEFDSKYGQYFNFPLAHLEDCTFNKYALQLCIYAYMAKKSCGLKIGRLAILFINAKYELTEIPVNNMYYEVEKIIDHYYYNFYNGVKYLKEEPILIDDDRF